jgi:hypothetical protein
MTITREQNSWQVTGGDSLGPGDIDKSRVDSYVSSVINTAGDDFISYPGPLNDGQLMLELGDGQVLVLRFGPADEENRRPAALSGLVYQVSSWALERIFREAEYFRNTNSDAR